MEDFKGCSKYTDCRGRKGNGWEGGWVAGWFGGRKGEKVKGRAGT